MFHSNPAGSDSKAEINTGKPGTLSFFFSYFNMHLFEFPVQCMLSRIKLNTFWYSTSL